ncbi:unnamed protein product [Mycena citricolor]|uniref:Zn(2)-C6 fungal-type domain-containing protein n=1 Tax=Mycena citricolor TaxID=2018698 RepID=A0AAD2JVZ9_9AGAR|nr:unnamed protein product [Mycena citricolor]
MSSPPAVPAPAPAPPEASTVAVKPTSKKSRQPRRQAAAAAPDASPAPPPPPPHPTALPYPPYIMNPPYPPTFSPQQYAAAPPPPGAPGAPQYAYPVHHAPYPHYYPQYPPQVMMYGPPPPAHPPAEPAALATAAQDSASAAGQKRKRKQSQPAGKDKGGSDDDGESADAASPSQSRAAAAALELKKRTKTQRACDSCRSRKIRCDIITDSEPARCQHCQQFCFDCTFFLPIAETRFRKKKFVEEGEKDGQAGQAGQAAKPSKSLSGDKQRDSSVLGPTSPAHLLHSTASISSRIYEGYDSRYHHSFEVSQNGDGLIRVAKPLSSEQETSTPRPIDYSIDPAMIEQLLNSYFADVQPLLPIITKPEFLALSSPPPILLWSMCLVAAARREVPQALFDSIRWAVNGVIRGEDVLSTPTMANVQALLILSMTGDCHSQFVPTALSAMWARLGAAIRMAQDLGLHRAEMVKVDIELRRRVWGACLISDRWTSLVYGFPQMIDVHDCDVRLPSSGDSKDIYLDELVRLSVIGGRVVKTIYSPSGLTLVTDDVLHKLLSDIENWKANLPESLRFKGPETSQSGGILHLLYISVCMIFWRVFMRISYACPAHLKFGLTVPQWTTLVALTGESIDWLDAHERVYDVWLLVAYAATSCAFVQYHTWVRRQDPEAVARLRKLRDCVRRWEGSLSPDHMSARRKTAEIITLLFEATQGPQLPLEIPALNPTGGVKGKQPLALNYKPDPTRPGGGVFIAQSDSPGLDDLPQGTVVREGEAAVLLGSPSTAGAPSGSMVNFTPLPTGRNHINVNPAMNMGPSGNQPVQVMNALDQLPQAASSNSLAELAITDTTFLEGIPGGMFDWGQWDTFFSRISQTLPGTTAENTSAMPGYQRPIDRRHLISLARALHSFRHSSRTALVRAGFGARTMKRLFSRPPKSPPAAQASSSLPASSTPTSINSPHITGLQPKYVVPPVPHPCPYDHIALLVTSGALLLRQHIPGLSASEPGPTSHLRLAWNKTVKVEEIQGDGVESEDADWSQSVVVYGIIGVLELFSASYLLVLSGKSEAGQCLDASRTVYNVKGVTAIPLVEHRARIALNTLASRNTHAARPSLIAQSKTLDSIVSDNDTEVESIASDTEVPRSPPRVQFSTTDDVHVMTPIDSSFSLTPKDHSAPTSPLSSTSDLSSLADDQSAVSSPVVKTLASRLSFWSRLTKRTATAPPTPDGATLPESGSLDEVIDLHREEPAAAIHKLVEAVAPAPSTAEERHSELEDKIVKEVVREFSKGGMYFAYTFDLTRSLQQKQELVARSQKKNALLADLDALDSAGPADSSSDGTVDALVEPHPTLPLWRRVDRQFWWNEWMSKPFVDAGVHPFVLPVMQGYFQSSTFNVPSESEEVTPADYTIISRRSRDRAGLRYQRRGIDDDAHVANFVETETILRLEREGSPNIFSYVQLRGSIPLFWTQTGLALKPPPVLATDRTHAQNLDAIRRHFLRTIPRYGPHTVVNLAEQHGKEGQVTGAYRDYMAELAEKDAVYHEYDFHQETKGMKYENISQLIDTMERTFEQQGYLWISGNYTMSSQKGIYRVNCIDCLDRTNVVQSAFARHVMNNQLSAVALTHPSSDGRTEADNVFNDVWANNGDAISRAYAGTSALKGDFTRTGKRDLSGMLNDGVNSLARMYTSTFSDWFSQAVIDFTLGNRTISVFSEFLLKLQSTDPRDLIRLSKIRTEAIATSVSRVLQDGERLLSGWTVFGPEELNAKIGDKFEEKVLLLTVSALYIISYDYTLEKVKMYTRIPLGDITQISKGAYILSPLEEASCDPDQNSGFVVSWTTLNETTRVSSYSIRNTLQALSRSDSTFKSKSLAAAASISRIPSSLGRATGPASSSMTARMMGPTVPMTNSFAAFKTLPIDPTRSRRDSSISSLGGSAYLDSIDELGNASCCREAADLMVDGIRRACEDIGNDADLVVDQDVVSLSEAQRMTSMYAKMEYGVKRLLWLGG